MEKLISMTDFVLEQIKRKVSVISHMICIEEYANLLKQPLTLGMFVPCSLENGMPLNDNGLVDSEGYVLDEIEFKEYQEAKERVLFEGFELRDRYLWNKDKLFMISDNYNESFSNTKSIEWLLSTMHEFNLTESAKKQIGI